MKKALKWLLRTVFVGIMIYAIIVITPYARTLFGGPQVRVDSVVISQTISDMEVLTTLKAEEDGEFSSSVPAALIGDVQRVSAPYHYVVNYGIDMQKAAVTQENETVRITLPDAEIVSSQMTVTGEVKKSDFLYPLTSDRYQEILNEQQKLLDEKYFSDEALLAQAKENAVTQIKTLMEKALGSVYSLQGIIIE